MDYFKSDELIFLKRTFPHRLKRIPAMEQIYKEKFHKSKWTLPILDLLLWFQKLELEWNQRVLIYFLKEASNQQSRATMPL